MPNIKYARIHINMYHTAYILRTDNILIEEFTSKPFHIIYKK